MLAFSFASSAHAQNAIVNADFDSSLSSWIQDKQNQVPCTWNGTYGYPGFGSAACFGPPLAEGTGMHQCVAVSTSRIDAVINVFGASAAVVALYPQDKPNCREMGAIRFVLTDEGPIDPNAPGWHRFALRFAPIGTETVMIDFFAGAGAANFDHVYVGPSDTIFIDQFE